MTAIRRARGNPQRIAQSRSETAHPRAGAAIARSILLRLRRPPFHLLLKVAQGHCPFPQYAPNPWLRRARTRTRRKEIRIKPLKSPETSSEQQVKTGA